jgi:F-type H+-transporting ATPase subunit alpha
LDDENRAIIEHGRRIRACFKQPEFAPVSLPEQIMVLLALTDGLLDPVPVDRVPDAERALRDAASDLPADVLARFETAPKLSAEDRQAVLAIARTVLSDFAAGTKTQTTGRSGPDEAMKEKQ